MPARVACKMENDVPLGDFRTSVKYVEKGRFPEVRRHFTVLRCNQCDAAPCVDICPVNALHKRPDAIVDLDRDLCIGCTACMQACPYDAIYLNEDNGVAEKCHYCAHRTELGLEPACVNVCPVEAIISGPVNEPESTISQYIKNHKTSRRKVEKGTRPRVWYVDALEEALIPGAEAESYLWSERPAEPPPVVPGFEPTPDILTTLDDAHTATWGGHIYLYILTKNICAGALLMAPLLGILGVAEGFMRDVLPEVVGLIFLVLTNALLVHDLGRPERFMKIIFHPNTDSWLVKGAWILIASGVVTSAALFLRLTGMNVTADTARIVNFPIAIFVSGYSAFLFHQCMGRDLWLGVGRHFWHLLLQAALLGGCLVAILPKEAGFQAPAMWLLAIFAGANAIWVLAEKAMKPRTASHGLFYGRKELNHAVYLLILTATIAVVSATATLESPLPTLLGITAGVLSVAALILYGKAWIEAGQALPNS